jgi:anaerobic magnesium-protoporphyrin IX monomethyl ester cyclase
LAKKINPETKTVVGGQHFTALANETLQDYQIIDFVIRGEGEETFTELVYSIDNGSDLNNIRGLSFRNKNKIVHNLDRPPISNLDSLPYPAYHKVEEHMKDYFFSLMANKNKPFAIIEGSRGCEYNCSYCSQWCFWGRSYRAKSPERVVDEFQYIYGDYGSRFFWFTDDNFRLGSRVRLICEEIIRRGLGDEIQWFCQIRVDDIVNNPDTVDLMKKAGCIWALVGFDHPNKDVLNDFRRIGVDKPYSKKAVELLREKGIFSQGTFIIGHRDDAHTSIEAIREYADVIDPDIASFFILTPFPGTEIYEEANAKGWIEDRNWANYDMVHAIMPTNHMSRYELQQELYDCYDNFFGSWPRRYRGISSSNPITRQTYVYLAKEALLTGLKSLI